jgi:tyrosyl-tRNA synthetase
VAGDISDGISIVQLIVRSGLAGSSKEVKRLISDGGAKMNDEPLTNGGLMITTDMLAQPIKLSAGKKRHALVTLG